MQVKEQLRKGEYEKYLFVDEFQDTDNKQIELLHFFATYWNIALFIVGDVKQCIYGFKGANDTAFKTIENITDYKKREWNVLHLRKNYRTNEALIKRLNNVFSKMSPNLFSYNSSDVLVAQKELNKSDPNCFISELYSDKKLIDILRKRKDELMKEGREGIIAILVRKNSEIDKIRKINESVDDFEIEFDNEGNFFKTDAVIDFYQLIDFLSEIPDNKRRYNISASPYCLKKISRSEMFNKGKSITFKIRLFFS
ncbi:UvrD-helicase domain-containing protein [Clostridium cagae]|uniref:UvrD-helicase domain-containing protein n=1 Tax=Clostridium cagae TaxID=2080751 RepID=UPI003F7641D7